MSSWWGNDNTRAPREGRDGGIKTKQNNINKDKTKNRKKNKKKNRTQGNAADAEMQSMGGTIDLARKQGNTANKEQIL